MIECQLCRTLNDAAAHYCAARNCGTALGPARAESLQLQLTDGKPQLLAARAVAVGARLSNRGSRAATVTVTVEGLPPALVQVQPSRVRLGPGECRTVSIWLSSPDPADRPADRWDCRVLATVPGHPAAGARVGLRPLPPPGPGGCTGAAAVPDVSRVDYPASSRRLLAAGFPGVDVAEHSADIPSGGTLSVSPAQGSVQPCGTPVTLVYSSGPAPDTAEDRALPEPPLCTLPPTGGGAAALLDRLRTLLAGDRSTPCALLLNPVLSYSASVPAGEVISEDPLPGSRVGPHSAVVITVSLGAPVCLLPSVVADSSAAALAALAAVGAAGGGPCRLTVVTSSVPSVGLPLGFVVAQEPSAGTESAVGAVVTLIVSGGPGPGPAPSPSAPAATPSNADGPAQSASASATPSPG
jgi:hypothetical protein